ncbi:MAG: Ig-like domain-containing protein [Eubacteriales bacterium]|nr:Ig-like domain-containing protein [Eubacteriales bacterium]
MKRAISLLLALILLVGTLAPGASASPVNNDTQENPNAGYVKLEQYQSGDQTFIDLPNPRSRMARSLLRNGGEKEEGLLYTFTLDIAPIMDDFDTLMVHVRDGDVHEVITLTKAEPVATRRCINVPSISYDNPDVLSDVTVYFNRSTQGQKLQFNVSRIANAAPRLQWFTNTPTDYKEKYIFFNYNHFIQKQTGYFEPNIEKTVTVLAQRPYYLPVEYYTGFVPGEDNQATVNREYLNISEQDQFDVVSVGFQTTGPNKETLDGDKIKIIGDKWYFYDITGSSRREGFQFNLREIQKVSFNSVEGKFGEEGPNAVTQEYEIGHSETLSKRGIVAPADIKAPAGKKLIGWKANNAGEIIAPAALGGYVVTANTVFYAQYGKDDDQFIKITADTSDAVNSTVETAGNPVEVAKGAKWADIKDQITGLVEANTGYAIYNWYRGADEQTVLDDTAEFLADETVYANIKKTVVDDNPKDDAYVHIIFQSDANEKTENGGHFGEAEEQKETIDKWVLKGQPRSVLAERPTPIANTGYKFNDWDKPYATGDFTQDETYTVTWTKLGDIIVDPTPDTDDDKPNGYVTVRFLPGDNGTLEGDTKYYVNPEAKPLKTMADITKPTIKANVGYKEADPAWKDAAGTALDTKTVIDKDLSYTAQYDKDKDIIGPFNPDGENVPDKPAGYATVTFLQGEGGTLTIPKQGEEPAQEGLEKVTYYVNPTAGKKMADLAAPDIAPNVGYEVANPAWKDAANEALSAETVITGDLSYTAQYKKLDDIIVDPTPDTDDDKPNGYVTVRFLPGDNGTLEGDAKYYVNPEAKPLKTMADITEPTIKANVGYKVTEAKWEPVLDKATEITKDLTYTAQYEKLDDIIGPVDPEDPNKPDKPDGYVTVSFLKGENGTLTIPAATPEEQAKVGLETVEYYVNPAAVKTMADVTAPQIVPNVGYKEATPAWKDAGDAALDLKTVIKGDLSYTAQYEKDEDIIGPFDPDGGKVPDKPAGYATVTFLKGKNGTLTIPKQDEEPAQEGLEKVAYYVNPTVGKTMADLAAPEIAPNVGFEVATPAWKDAGDAALDPATEIKGDLNYTAQYKKLDDIIVDPTPDTDDDKPNGYVTVRFLPDINGTLTGDTKFYVNPQAVPVKTMADITEPTIKANVGYKVKDTKWDPVLDKATEITKDLTYTAQYDKLDDIIPVNPVDPGQPFNPEDQDDKNNDNKTPEGYVRIIFDADEGNFGKYQPGGQEIKKTAYDVKADLTWADFKANVPAEVNAVAGKTFSGTWNPVLPADGTTVAAETYVAQYTDNIIGPVDPDNPDPADPEKPDTHVTVTFDKGAHGTIAGKRVYYVNPTTGTTIGELEKPAITPNAGYDHTGWDVADTTVIDKNMTVTAEYSAHDIIGPVDPDNPDPADPEKPDTHVTVTFDKGAHGKIAGKRVYYVNPAAGKTIGELAKPAITPDEGYTHIGWDVGDDTVINKNMTVTAQYKAPDIIGPVDPDKPDPEDPEKPDTHVTVTFDKGAHGKIAGKRTYYVNPTAGKTIADLGKPAITADEGYEHIGWDVPDTTVIDKDMTVTAQYKAADIIGPVDPDNPDPADPEKPDTHVTVTFDKGAHGKIAGKRTYYVNPAAGLTIGDLAKPAITANKGYAHTGWDVPDTTVIDKDMTVTALYTADDIIGPVDPDNPDPTDPEKPETHVTVIFEAGEHGTIIGKRAYYVNPKAGKTIGDLVKPALNVDDGYEHTGWDTDDATVIDKDLFVTALYAEVTIVPEKPSKPKDVDAVTKDDKTTVTGKADPNVDIVIKDTDGNVIGKGKTDDKGNFSIVTDKKLDPGTKIKVVAVANGVESDPATTTVRGVKQSLKKPVTTKKPMPGTGAGFGVLPLMAIMAAAAVLSRRKYFK